MTGTNQFLGRCPSPKVLPEVLPGMATLARSGFPFDMMLPLFAEAHRITSQAPRNEGGLFTQGAVGLPTGTRLRRTRTPTLPGVVRPVSIGRHLMGLGRVYPIA